MNLETANAFLEALALLNNGVNHGSSYFLECLPEAAGLDEALAKYFACQSTSVSRPEPAERWKIQVKLIDGDWVPRIKEAAGQWFFQQGFLPRIEDSWVKEAVIMRFIAHLTAVVGDARLYEVQTSPPMFYECWWEDFAFSNADKNWLLHFGFSD